MCNNTCKCTTSYKVLDLSSLPPSDEVRPVAGDGTPICLGVEAAHVKSIAHVPQRLSHVLCLRSVLCGIKFHIFEDEHGLSVLLAKRFDAGKPKACRAFFFLDACPVRGSRLVQRTLLDTRKAAYKQMCLWYWNTPVGARVNTPIAKHGAEVGHEKFGGSLFLEEGGLLGIKLCQEHGFKREAHTEKVEQQAGHGLKHDCNDVATSICTPNSDGTTMRLRKCPQVAHECNLTQDMQFRDVDGATSGVPMPDAHQSATPCDAKLDTRRRKGTASLCTSFVGITETNAALVARTWDAGCVS
jgi:hypothetical protein